MGATHPKIEDPWEHMVYWAHVRAAQIGDAAPLRIDLAARIGCESETGITGIEQRMERRGWIKVERFQRERRVEIVATGEKTREPKNKAPHWRQRPEHGCESVALLQRRKPELHRDLLLAARRERKSLAALLVEVIALGWAARLIQAGAAEG